MSKVKAPIIRTFEECKVECDERCAKWMLGTSGATGYVADVEIDDVRLTGRGNTPEKAFSRAIDAHTKQETEP